MSLTFLVCEAFAVSSLELLFVTIILLVLILVFFVFCDNFCPSSDFELTLGRNCLTLGGRLAGTSLKSLLANGEWSLQRTRGRTTTMLATRWSKAMLMKKAMEQQVKTRLEVEMNTPVQNVPVTTPRTTGYECLWCGSRW